MEIYLRNKQTKKHEKPLFLHRENSLVGSGSVSKRYGSLTLLLTNSHYSWRHWFGGSQRDVVYLGRPIAPKCRGMRVSANTSTAVHGAQINFEDLTAYLPTDAGADSWEADLLHVRVGQRDLLLDSGQDCLPTQHKVSCVIQCTV